MSATDVPPASVLHAAARLLPWAAAGADHDLAAYVEAHPQEYLRSFHLFALNELAVPDDAGPAAAYARERYASILAAAAQAGLTVATVIIGEEGRVRVLLGFRHDDVHDPGLFQRLVEGSFPGTRLAYDEKLALDQLFAGKVHQGLVTGIPPVFGTARAPAPRIASAVRGAGSETFVVMLTARPVPRAEVASQFAELSEVADASSALARQVLTVGQESGSREERISLFTAGAEAGAGVGFRAGTETGALKWVLPIKLRLAMEVSAHTHARMDEGSRSERWEQRALSLTREEQDRQALEVAQLADALRERLKQGLSTGYWETTLSLACGSALGRDILAGCLLGELSHPEASGFTPRLFAPPELREVPLVPRSAPDGALFDKTLCSYVTGSELAALAAPPGDPLPGFNVRRVPRFRLAASMSATGVRLGEVAEYGCPVAGVPFALSPADLARHLLVCGSGGSGKTRTVWRLLAGLDTPFLVLESARREYRRLLTHAALRDRLRVIPLGEATVPELRLNPLYVPQGAGLTAHLQYVSALFAAAMPLGTSGAERWGRLLAGAYEARGWDLSARAHPFFGDNLGGPDAGAAYAREEHRFCFPILDDVRQAAARETERWARAAARHLERQCDGVAGVVLNTHEFPDLSALLEGRVVVEMDELATDARAVLAGVVVLACVHLRQSHDAAVGAVERAPVLRHVLVLDEVPRALFGANAAWMAELLAAMRVLGNGLVLVAADTETLAPDVLRAVGGVVSHRQARVQDRAALEGALDLNGDRLAHLSRLRPGDALCHLPGDQGAVEVRIDPLETRPVSAERIRSGIPDEARRRYAREAQTARLRLAGAGAGRRVAVQLLNTLVRGASAGILVDTALARLVEAVRPRLRTVLDPDALRAWLLDEVLALYASGGYFRRYPDGDAAPALLRRWVTDNDAESAVRLRQALLATWAPQAESEVVEALASLFLTGYADEGDRSPFLDTDSRKISASWDADSAL